MTDLRPSLGSGGSATEAFVITPNNSTDLASPIRGIYVGTAGDLKVDLIGNGTGITFKNLAAGMVHPISAKRVYATGTTATDIIGVY